MRAFPPLCAAIGSRLVKKSIVQIWDFWARRARGDVDAGLLLISAGCRTAGLPDGRVIPGGFCQRWPVRHRVSSGREWVPVLRKISLMWSLAV